MDAMDNVPASRPDEEDEKFDSFFHVDESDPLEEDLEDEALREKLREQKLKSFKERKRLGDKREPGPKNTRFKK